MQLKIITDKENPLLERRKIEFRIIHKGAATPAKKDVAELLAAKLNANLDLMFLKHFNSKFGENISEGTCLIYKNKKNMESIESIKLLSSKKRIGEKSETQDSEKK